MPDLPHAPPEPASNTTHLPAVPVPTPQADQANPALLFGVPLLLGAAAPAQRVKVVHDGELADLTQQQLLGLVCSSLRWAHCCRQGVAWRGVGEAGAALPGECSGHIK